MAFEEAVDDVLVDDQPVDDAVEEVEEGVEEGVEEAEGVEEDAEEGEQGEQGGGKRPFSARSIREAVRALAETNPEQAKILKQLAEDHFRTENTYKKMFPTIEAVTEAKEIIDAVGGLDGVRGLQERVEAYSQQDSKLNSGDPAILDEIFSQFPDGAASLAPHYLEKLAAASPTAFTEAVAPYVLGLMSNAGVINHVSAMMQESDTKRLQAMVNSLGQWLDGEMKKVGQLANKPKSNVSSQQQSALERERAELQAEKNQIFISKIESAAVSKITPVINSIIQQQTKNFKLSPTQVSHYKEVLDRKVLESLNANTTYQKQLQVRITNKTAPEALADYMAAEYNRVAKSLALETASSIFSSGKTAKPTLVKKPVGNESEAAPSRAVLVSRQPSDTEIDWSKPNSEYLFIQNKAYLKSGRLVTWR